MDLHVTHCPPRERRVTATSAHVVGPAVLALEAAAGGAAGLATDTIFYGLDSYKVQKQQAGGAVDVRRLFRGLLPLSMMGTVPSFGLFFLAYEPTKRALADHGVDGGAGVALASLAAGVPASLVYVPADVVKKRVVLGHADGPVAAVRQAVASSRGWGGLMVGWRANLVRDVPFAVFKLSLYEGCVRTWEALVCRPGERAGTHAATLCGVASGAATAVLTNPLDVLNTRLKAGVGGEATAAGAAAAVEPSMAAMARHVLATEGAGPLFVSGLAPRIAILGLGSGVFWGAYAHARALLGLDALAAHR